ncbi:MAG: hypothetical protein LBE33_09875 [Zoogloeaceae bacterium]|jgi:hypothetical protein|nr:hypothetical protein [Zoogloeaceae bacterium]
MIIYADAPKLSPAQAEALNLGYGPLTEEAAQAKLAQIASTSSNGDEGINWATALGGGFEFWQNPISDASPMSYSEQMGNVWTVAKGTPRGFINGVPKLVMGAANFLMETSVFYGASELGATHEEALAVSQQSVAGMWDGTLLPYNNHKEALGGFAGEFFSPFVYAKDLQFGSSLIGSASSIGVNAAESAAINPLRAGQLAEIEQLNALGSGGKVAFTPTQAQIDSATFKLIVGDAKYTAQGTPVGTIYDASLGTGLGEIKTGSSVLNSSYQLRLQTYGSLVNDTPFTIFTSRPVNPTFGDWLTRWGVEVKPLPR